MTVCSAGLFYDFSCHKIQALKKKKSHCLIKVRQTAKHFTYIDIKIYKGGKFPAQYWDRRQNILELNSENQCTSMSFIKCHS